MPFIGAIIYANPWIIGYWRLASCDAEPVVFTPSPDPAPPGPMSCCLGATLSPAACHWPLPRAGHLRLGPGPIPPARDAAHWPAVRSNGYSTNQKLLWPTLVRDARPGRKYANCALAVIAYVRALGLRLIGSFMAKPRIRPVRKRTCFI
jgi:hypothetical protein